MSLLPDMKIRWRFGLIAGLFLAIFSLYPQFKMLYLRGAEWNGHYAYNDIDEVAYASYIKALIDGRPRKNDPYTGRDDSPENPQPESLFSIQFAGPYTIALPARFLGIDAPWAMTISGAAAAFLTALAIFWIVGMVTEDSWFAMAASLAVLAGGALWAGEGAIGEITGWSYAYPYFPGFRRYLPAMAFPAFFLMVGVVWRLVGRTDDDGRVDGLSDEATRGISVLTIGIAASAFAYTIFSYFYVWTTAAAWVACVGLCWAILRPAGFVRDLKLLAWLAAGCGLILLPYFYLLSKRSHTMDDVQMLVRTHAPDLTRPPELIAFVVLAVIAGGVLMKMFELRDRRTLFALSLALTTILIFNQQVVTGHSLQPIHYQVFIGNYVAGLALFVTLGLIWRASPIKRCAWARPAALALTLIAAAWGFVECHYTVRILDDVNVIRDEAFPVARRLAEIDKEDVDRHKKVVLYQGIAEADDMPTVAPQSVLWARHQHIFAGVTWQENKERYYQQMHYDGVSPSQLAQGIKDGEDIVSLIALFGWGRHTERLNSEYRPLTYGEIDDEARRYAEYIRNFDATHPGAVRLDYLVTAADRPESAFANIDKWYQRYDGESFGRYALYRLRLRQ